MPVVKRPVSKAILRDLEAKLHGLLRESFPKAYLGPFVLPRLEPLVEFDSAVMWFPLHPERPKATRGVEITMLTHPPELTHLPEVELEVKFKWEQFKYRISADGVQRVIW